MVSLFPLAPAFLLCFVPCLLFVNVFGASRVGTSVRGWPLLDDTDYAGSDLEFSHARQTPSACIELGCVSRGPESSGLMIAEERPTSGLLPDTKARYKAGGAV